MIIIIDGQFDVQYRIKANLDQNQKYSTDKIRKTFQNWTNQRYSSQNPKVKQNRKPAISSSILSVGDLLSQERVNRGDAASQSKPNQKLGNYQQFHQ